MEVRVRLCGLFRGRYNVVKAVYREQIRGVAGNLFDALRADEDVPRLDIEVEVWEWF